MDAKDVFGIVVRTVGLFVAVNGVRFLVFAIAESVGLCDIDAESRDRRVSACLYTGGGLMILYGASAIVAFTYGSGRRDQ